MTNSKNIENASERPIYYYGVGGLRKVPRQPRAIKTVELILKTAAELIQKNGLEAACTTSIAERASIPVGAVYRYFRDMSAIETELILRGLNHLEQEIISIHQKIYSDSAPKRGIADDVDKVTDAILAFYEHADGAASVLPIMQTSPVYHDINLTFQQRLGEQIADLFEEARVPLQPSKMRVAAITSVKIGSAMQDLVWSATSDEERTQFIIEWKRALTAYLNALAVE